LNASDPALTANVGPLPVTLGILERISRRMGAGRCGGPGCDGAQGYGNAGVGAPIGGDDAYSQ
jgi:hypothetical protein